jgi:prepilin peptidase CpaA
MAPGRASALPGATYSGELTFMTFGQFVPVLAVAVAVCAGIVDVRERRIPNRLTYSGIGLGFVLQAMLHGWNGLLLSAGGFLLFGGVFMLFFVVRAMGAGDVKLAAALGSIVGSSATFAVMFATASAGAALAVLLMIGSGRLLETLRSTLSVSVFHLQHGLQAHPLANLDNPTGLRMPYGLAFALGTLYWAVSSALWR